MELSKVQCPCGTVFQVLPSLGVTDEEGNFRCQNCAVELGLTEELIEEPPDSPPSTASEGSDAEFPEEPAEAPGIPQEASKIDLRTKEGRALKAALEAAQQAESD